MPLDAVCLHAVAEELRPRVLGARIDKAHQPSRDQVILLLRGNLRLLINAGANSPRIQLTEQPRDNPAEPPMFCMLLRKHLTGGRIAALTQPDMERLIELEIEITDDLGQPGKRFLILEAIGRRSNLVLLDESRRIVECLHRVDAEMSPERQVLPGLYYAYPPNHGRRCLTSVSEEEFRACLAASNPERRLDDFLLENFFGLSPLSARELAYRTAGESDARLCELTAGQRESFWREVGSLIDDIKENNFTPICLRRDGKPVDFSCRPIAQYGALMEQIPYETFSALLDDFFASREQQERLRQRGQDLLRTASSARDRLRRKLEQQEKDYAATQDRDQLRVCGDLITANLYRMERGRSSFRTENFYDPDGGETVIPLDPLLTPQQNAAKYFKRYAKAKTAEGCLQEQMAIARRDIAYLESVLEELREAESEQDFLDIRAELRDAGYLPRREKEKKELRRATKPREFCTSGGFRVLVGRNNRQNDQLTLKTADSRDLWLHTQKIHGAHVILCTGGAEAPAEDLVEAAKIAAWFSQARESGNVPVDYTPVRNVKKPAGARPGMVIYPTCRTVNVVPDEGLVRRLARRPT